MVRKCNQLKMTPIQLLTELYKIANKNLIKVETINEIFIWQNRDSAKKTFEELQNTFKSQKIMRDFNIVQTTALTKFNIFYSLCFKHSYKFIENIIQRKGIIPEHEPLKDGGILADFDYYFKK